MQVFGTTTLDELYDEGLISVRSKNACNYVGIHVVSDITEYIHLYGSLASIPHLGKKSIQELTEVLAKLPVIQSNSRVNKVTTLNYGKRIAHILKEIIESEKVDRYAANCLLAPIIEIPPIDQFRNDLDYTIQTKWRQAINEVLAAEHGEIADYVRTQYFRWRGLDLLHQICFYPEQIINDDAWCSKETHIIFIKKVQQTFRLFVGWLLRNDFYGNDYIRTGFRDSEYIFENYISDSPSSGKVSRIEVTNDYYYMLLEECGNSQLADITKKIAPQFYDAIKYCSLSFDDFFKIAKSLYDLTDTQKRDIYGLFISIKSALIEAIIEEDSSIVEGKIIEKKFPFVRKEWGYFMASFKRSHSHYPMFYLLQQILSCSTNYKDKTYSEYYGIGCPETPSVAALADKHSTSRQTILNILKKVPKAIESKGLLQMPDWDFYPIIHDSVIEEYSSELSTIIDSEQLTVTPKALIEGILSLHFEYNVFSVNGYSYYFRKDSFQDFDPVEGLKYLKKLSKSGSREAQTIYMFNLFGDHNFKTWVPFRTISLIIEQELGFTLEDDEYIDIESRFDADALLIEILENENKPMTLSDILEQYNNNSPEPSTTEAIKARLYRLNDVVTLGNTGYFGLSYWKNIYFGNIRDLIVEVMDEYGHPIYFNTIFNRVLQFFPNTNERSVESSIKQTQTHYTFKCIGNKFYCSEEDREKIYDSFVELHSPSEEERLREIETFLTEYQRFPLRQGCFAEASLRNWIHEVTTGVKTLSTPNKLKLDSIFKKHFNSVQEDTSHIIITDGYNGQISSFLSGEYEFYQNNDLVLGKQIDIAPKVIDYIKNICQIPFKDFVSYITNNVLPVAWTSSDITQNSNSDDCHVDLCRALMSKGNPGLDFNSLGECLLNDGIERNEGAYRKYGENHVKSAAQLGLTYENNGLWYLTDFGKVFCSIDRNLQYNLMARVLLKSPFYASIVSDASMHKINIAQYMDDLSESTRKRRIPSVRKMVDIILYACETNQKLYFNLIDAINDNSDERESIANESTQASVNLIDKPKTDAERIVEYLSIHPNQMAKDIANALGMERREVNSILYTTLSKKVKQDKSYKWSLLS